MADIETREVRLPSHVEGLQDVTASFTAMTNVPARLQVWLHDENKPGRVGMVDVKMFLRSLEMKRDAIPAYIHHGFTSYITGAKEVDAHLIDDPGWTWKFQIIDGHRVAVPVEVRHRNRNASPR